jgi:membrane protein YdbS with pleckstrin-like domain
MKRKHRTSLIGELRRHPLQTFRFLSVLLSLIVAAVGFLVGLVTLLFYAVVLASSEHWWAAAFCIVAVVALVRPLLALASGLVRRRTSLPSRS